MSQRAGISLEQRRLDYAEAERIAVIAAEVWFDAKVTGRNTDVAIVLMDEADADLRRAKRRLEDTERRLAKRATTA